jgi:hypothetical protein
MTSLQPIGRVSILFTVVVAAVIAAGLAFSVPSLLKRNGKNAPEEVRIAGPAASVTIPAIDKDVPDHLETATFAFG